jgi:hypothetical protein
MYAIRAAGKRNVRPPVDQKHGRWPNDVAEAVRKVEERPRWQILLSQLHHRYATTNSLAHGVDEAVLGNERPVGNQANDREGHRLGGSFRV